MNRFIELANTYVKESDWKTLGMIKVCLCAAGIMIGTAIPKKHRKPVAFVAMTVFIVTYVPLMCKFLRIALADKSEA